MSESSSEQRTELTTANVGGAGTTGQDCWTPPRTPAIWRLENLPFRRAHRAKVDAGARLVSPGHPGRAQASLLDVSEEGAFIEDAARTFALGDNVRIGLEVPGEDDTIWASAYVRWRGEKRDRAGCGVRLKFDGHQEKGQWRGAVADWMAANASA